MVTARGAWRSLLVAAAMTGAIALTGPALTGPARAETKTHATAGPIPPAGYKFQPPAACIEDAERVQKSIRPNQASYQICADQMAIFTKALAEARAQNKMLLVTFGATWCPWCASLQKRMHTDEVLGRTGEAIDYGRIFHHVEIGVSMTDKGKKAGIPSGEAVLETVLARAPGVKIRAIPFAAVIDPKKPARVWARNTDDVATKEFGHDAARFRALLQEAYAHVLGQAEAPAEPGWLHRKWLRWWYG